MNSRALDDVLFSHIFQPLADRLPTSPYQVAATLFIGQGVFYTLWALLCLPEASTLLTVTIGIIWPLWMLLTAAWVFMCHVLKCKPPGTANFERERGFFFRMWLILLFALLDVPTFFLSDPITADNFAHIVSHILIIPALYFMACENLPSPRVQKALNLAFGKQ